MSDRTNPEKRKPATIPNIDIEKSVTNDICLFLNTLLPTKDIARLIRNYDTFFFEYLAETRLLTQIITRQRDYLKIENRDKSEAKPEKAEETTSEKISWLNNNGSLLR